MTKKKIARAKKAMKNVLKQSKIHHKANEIRLVSVNVQHKKMLMNQKIYAAFKQITKLTSLVSSN